MRLDLRAAAATLGVVAIAAGGVLWWASPEKPKPCEELYSDCLMDLDNMSANSVRPDGSADKPE